jgi:hypothetical protein
MFNSNLNLNIDSNDGKSAQTLKFKSRRSINTATRAVTPVRIKSNLTKAYGTTGNSSAMSPERTMTIQETRPRRNIKTHKQSLPEQASGVSATIRQGQSNFYKKFFLAKQLK